MKKNVIAIVAAVALVIFAVPTIAFANGMQQTWCPSGGSGSLAHHAMRAAGDSDAGATVGAAIATVRGEYVDRNNDGVCDNYGVGKGANQGACPGYADADGDGIGDNERTGIVRRRRRRKRRCDITAAVTDGVAQATYRQRRRFRLRRRRRRWHPR